jgi:hypothetical protein
VQQQLVLFLPPLLLLLPCFHPSRQATEHQNKH